MKHTWAPIFDRSWELLEESCTELDLTLAMERARVNAETFQRCSQAHQEASRLRQQQLGVQQQHKEVIDKFFIADCTLKLRIGHT